ncbi:MAG: Holliday junction resolvase RuvX [bacterium]
MGRILAVDLGEKRVGFALSDPTGFLASSLETAHVSNSGETLAAVKRLCSAHQPERIVIGLPLNMDGTNGIAAQKVTAFAARLREKVGLPVDLWDERLTTRLVQRVLIEANLSRSRRKEVVDQLAAQVILQSYLDAHGGNDMPEEDDGA